MNSTSNAVSIHPYFQIHPGKLEGVKALLSAFVEKTAAESKNLYYAFTLSDHELFCREAYVDADGVLAHLKNVGALLEEVLKSADLIRFEVHGPPAELEQLKEPLATLKPKWFVHECGLAQ